MTKRDIKPSKSKRNRELFRKGADILRRGKWTRGNWFKGDKPGDNMLGSYCLTGAILKAEAIEKGQTEKLTNGSLDNSTYTREPWYEELRTALGESPEDWNDRIVRDGAKNKQEVIEVLEALAGEEVSK